MEFVNRIRIEALRSQESFQLGKFERTLLIPGTQSKFDIHYPRIVCSFDSLWAKPFSSPSVSKLCELGSLKSFPSFDIYSIIPIFFRGISQVCFSSRSFHRDDTPLAFHACAVHLQLVRLFERRIDLSVLIIF